VLATAVIALTPLLIDAGARYPRPDLTELIVQLAAGALPACYFWRTTRPGPRSLDAARADLSKVVAVLPTIARFTAAVLVGVAIGAVAEAAAWGLRAAVPAVAVAGGCTLGARLLRRDWPSATWPVLSGFAALGAALVIGAGCLAWRVGVDYDNTAVRVVGVAAIAVCCCAGILAAADVRRDRSGRTPARGARDRAG